MAGPTGASAGHLRSYLVPVRGREKNAELSGNSPGWEQALLCHPHPVSAAWDCTVGGGGGGLSGSDPHATLEPSWQNGIWTPRGPCFDSLPLHHVTEPKWKRRDTHMMTKLPRRNSLVTLPMAKTQRENLGSHCQRPDAVATPLRARKAGQ